MQTRLRSCLRLLILVSAALMPIHSAGADSAGFIGLTLSPNVYTATAGSEITLSGFFTTPSPLTFTYGSEDLFGLTSASPHLNIVSGSLLSSLDFNPPISGAFFQDTFGDGGFLGPTQIAGPTVTSVSDLRTFLIPFGTPPGEYLYSYGVAFGSSVPSLFDTFTLDVVSPVPEPSGLVLLAFALGFMALTLSRSRGRYS
jgi:hypothetical protein